jgi:hypothetical protein
LLVDEAVQQLEAGAWLAGWLGSHDRKKTWGWEREQRVRTGPTTNDNKNKPNKPDQTQK